MPTKLATKGRLNRDEPKEYINGRLVNYVPVPIIFDVSFFSTVVENDKEKILEILGRVSEKKKLDKLKQKYKELYDKVKNFGKH